VSRYTIVNFAPELDEEELFLWSWDESMGELGEFPILVKSKVGRRLGR
jgi:hypothetical protein